MGVNWALALPQGNPGESFTNAYEHAQERQKTDVARRAMAALAQDPSNQRAYQVLASIDPQAAMQFQQQRIALAKQQMGEHYDSVLKGAQIIRQMQPKDDAGWQQVLQTAAQVGIDISQVPQHYDPQYVQQVVGLAMRSSRRQRTTSRTSRIRRAAVCFNTTSALARLSSSLFRMTILRAPGNP
jgi:hypothetical protein